MKYMSILRSNSVIVLVLTTRDGIRRSSVPTSVYSAIVAIQSLGIFVALLLQTPSQIRRNDSRAIAIFERRSLREELIAWKRTIVDRRVWFLSLGFFGSQLFQPLFMTLNAFYFDAQGRALVNVSGSKSRRAWLTIRTSFAPKSHVQEVLRWRGTLLI